MRKWIRQVCWALAAVILAVLLWFSLGGEQPPPVTIRGLFLGDQGHHQPANRFAQLEPAFRMKGIELVYTDQLDDLNPETLSQYDVLLIYANHREISEQQEEALLNFVSSGGGFVPIHSASYCFLNSPQYVELVGAQFKSHETGVFEARIVDPTHSVTEGLEEFETWDETYLHYHHNPDRHVLMVREENGHQEPWSWVRTHGEGRIFYTAYGHDHRTWSHPEFHRLLEQGVRWCVAERQAPQRLDNPKPVEYVEATIPYYDQPWQTAEPQTQMQLPLTPEESLKRMQVPEGFEVQLFASEPDVINPVAMAWDAQGRLWIAETVDYPNEKHPTGQGNDRIKICEDTDGDGRADQFTVFADGLSIPTSLVFANRGVIVAQPPDVLFLKDNDGDDRADERQVLFSGFGVWDTHASANNFRWGLDNWIWGTVGYSGFQGTVGGETHDFRQGIYRFRPDGSKLEFLASTSNNTWGLGFTEEGFVFASTANDQHSVYMGIPNRYYEGVYGWAPGVLPGIADHSRFHPIKENVRQVDWHGGYTAAAGHSIYTARSFPRAYWNRVGFVAEPSGSLLHKCVLRPQGSHFVSHDARNLLAGDDEWVAPIAAEVGPDGAVWMIDWYNYIVQHNPTPHGFENGPGNAYETPLRDKEHGRIYRIVHGNGTQSRSLDLSSAGAAELVEALSHNNLFWRLAAQRLLCERGEVGILPKLMELVGDPNVDELGLNVGAVHALWTLHGLGLLDGGHEDVIEVALQALRHSSPAVRLTAVRILPRSDSVREALFEMLVDSAAHVRLEALLALSETEQDEKTGQAIFEALKRPENLRDRWIPDAIVAAAARHSPDFLQSFSQGFPHDLVKTGSSLQSRLTHMFRLVATDYARQAPADTVLAVLRAVHEAPAFLIPPILEGLAEGWPGGAVPQFDEAELAELNLLVRDLPEDQQQDHLLILIERWGQQQALAMDIASVVERLRQQVVDSSLPAEVRSQAARRLIRLDGAETSLQLILDHITAQTPLDVTRGLLNSLTESPSERVASGLLRRWDTLSPEGREAAVQTLLRRSSWARSLLEAIDGGVVHHSELKAEQLQQLTLHSDEEIAEYARRLAETSGRAYSSDRLEIIERMLPAVTQGGDRGQGRVVFEENCRRCHSFQGEGGLIGPDLAGLGNRNRADILVDILDPSRSVEGNYRLWLITTEDGESWAGRLESETQTTVELLTASGVRHVIPRQSIAKIRASRLSIMPDGFEEQIAPHELADLLEYLTSAAESAQPD